jgi:hypothetical protein
LEHEQRGVLDMTDYGKIIREYEAEEIMLK